MVAHYGLLGNRVKAPTEATVENCRRCGIVLVVGDKIKGYCRFCYYRLASGEKTKETGVTPRPITATCPCGMPVYGKIASGLCVRCDRSRLNKKKWLADKVEISPETRRNRELLRARKKTIKLKLDVMTAYGGKCECCGETGIWFLTIDHINGDGKADRAKIGSGIAFYRYLRNHNYPRGGYRILCFNCNMVLGLYGFCPHNKVDKEWMNLFTSVGGTLL